MRNKLQRILTLLPAILLFAGFSASTIFAQQTEPIGGPYEADSATVLLMHFNENFNAESGENFQIGEPEIFGNISFLQMDGAGDLGHQVRFDNDSPNDLSHIQIPDTAALDLNGSWTMEMWVNVFTFGQTQEDHRRQPRLYFKPGSADGCYCYSNYFFNIFGTQQNFQTGFYDGGSWQEVDSPDNIMQIGQWFHLTYIRDTTKNVILQMIHQNADDPGLLPNENDSEMELISFGSLNYGDSEPVNTPQPLFIATSPQNDTLFANLDGFMDEIRISNTVRQFNVPPIITLQTDTTTIKSGEPFEVNSTIETIGDLDIAEAQIHYRIDDGELQTEDLAEGADNSFTHTFSAMNIGTSVEYRIEAETGAGLSAVEPSDSTFYSFGVGADSTEVLNVSFNGLSDGDNPVDSSQYGLDIAYEGSTSPTYESGAMNFSAADSTLLTIESPFLSLNSFGIETKFMFKDSVPQSTDPRIFAKRNGAVYQSNYQIYFQDGSARPAAYLPGNECETFLGNALHMTDAPFEADKWYTLGFAKSTVRDTIFTWVKDTEADTVMASRGTCATVNPATGSGSLFVGAQDESGPYFNGQIDNFEIFNYVPEHLNAVSIEEPGTLPRKVTLGKNYPNPFNPTTNIDFSLPQASDVELQVYDVLGRHVATLIDGKRQAGSYSVNFDASNLSSGVYLYRLNTAEVTRTRKMLLIK